MRSKLCAIALLMATAVSLAQAQPASSGADQVDQFIESQMKTHAIPGLSLAIIENGKILKAKGYGFADREKKTPVTPATLFQAGSVSKSVAALGALHLVEQGKLSLDENVNVRLKGWKLPGNEYTKEQKVTPRRLLSHTAGLTVHGFPGYPVDASIPSLIQILDGHKPANTPAIRVDTVPGTLWRYSGGGYTVMQKMMIDVTGQTFPQYMQKTVLMPLGMTHSTFEQPLPPAKAKETASGYYADGKAVKGRWHIYPEMAAAGLWTTPSDLARFAIGIQKTVAGKATPVISQSMAHQMLTDQKDNDGLGVFLQGKGRNLRFNHNGRDEGFDALLTAYAETGQGAVIMINANENSGAVGRIMEVIAETYDWPNHPRPAAAKPAPAARKKQS
jgi:CubicO group peptidase (beta-lactamase class C family)